MGSTTVSAPRCWPAEVDESSPGRPCASRRPARSNCVTSAGSGGATKLRRDGLAGGVLHMSAREIEGSRSHRRARTVTNGDMPLAMRHLQGGVRARRQRRQRARLQARSPTPPTTSEDVAGARCAREAALGLRCRPCVDLHRHHLRLAGDLVAVGAEHIPVRRVCRRKRDEPAVRIARRQRPRYKARGSKGLR